MPSLRDQAIVLTRLDYSETSQIIVFLTRDHGKVRAIAKGIKRGTKTRFVTGTDLLDIGEMVVSIREERAPGLAILTEWKQTRSLIGLREKLPRIYAGQYAADLTARLTEDWDPHADLFDALNAALNALADADDVLETVVRYQTALLQEIGSMPRFDACVDCGRTEDATYFSAQEGGLMCRHCEPGHVEKRALSDSALRTLRILITHPSAGSCVQSALPPSGYVGAYDILDYYLTHLTGRPSSLADKLVSPQTRRTIR